MRVSPALQEKCSEQKVSPCSSHLVFAADSLLTDSSNNSTLEKVTDQLRAQSRILEAVFPGFSQAELSRKTNDELISIVNLRNTSSTHQPSQHQQQTTSAPPANEATYTQSQNNGDDSAPLSENGDAAADRQWDESLDQPSAVATDDINAIGLATDKQARSYLGLSSMSAAFSAIFKLYPPTKEHTAQRARACAAAPPAANQLSVPALTRDPALSLLREQRCIDFYFDHFHAVVPLIDEHDFRRQYAAGDRRDGSWMGLLNMVFALGSIASGSETLHEEYYKEARAFFSLDSLGNGNTYSLQALCLLGGFYLHYRNSPNMAYGILGAAHRVAIALGLHREPRKTNITDPAELRRLETRRRTWWCLICLDSWACMTQGRPTCGRWEGKAMDTALPTSMHPEDHAALSLHASARFCLICDKIQERFALLGRITPDEILAFDDELQAWYDTLPVILKQVDTSAHPRLQVAREFMRTRYLNARVILARCSMLLMAQNWRRKTYDEQHHLMHEQRHALMTRCCAIATEAIDAVALYWTPNRFLVWNSGWYLFQACTVPLLAMAMERHLDRKAASVEFAGWQESLAKALAAFAEMRPWMRASDRSPDIVSAMYEALTAETDTMIRTPSATDGSLDLFGWCDEQFADMDWGMFLGEETVSADMLPLP